MLKRLRCGPGVTSQGRRKTGTTIKIVLSRATSAGLAMLRPAFCRFTEVSAGHPDPFNCNYPPSQKAWPDWRERFGDLLLIE